jgi:hypothetical protein
MANGKYAYQYKPYQCSLVYPYYDMNQISNK